VGGDADLAFVCGPSYASFASDVTLVPAAPVFDDPRAAGRPVYFAEVVAPADRSETSLVELGDARFAYNDPTSLSGRLAVLAHFRAMRLPPPQMTASGAHEVSLELLQSGAADFCSIDSIVWRRLTAEESPLERGLRVVVTLGPFPIQPIVAAARVPAATVDRIARALRMIDESALAPSV
jgi:ABC-type phosphate/phosphonate transport system substrate-binding protein